MGRPGKHLPNVELWSAAQSVSILAAPKAAVSAAR